MPRLLCSCIALLLALSSPSAAQESSLAPGARALSFALPYGGGTEFGYWRMTDEARRVGLFVGFDTGYRHQEDDVSEPGDREGDSFGFSVRLGPVARSYWSTEGKVVPFWQSDLSIGYGYNRAESRWDSRSWSQSSHHGTIGAGLGIGLEWFPVPQVSVSGHTGIRATAGYNRLSEDVDERRSEQWSVDLRTFASALQLTIYLPPRP